VCKRIRIIIRYTQFAECVLVQITNKMGLRIEELLDAQFSMRSVSYQRKVGDQSFQEFLVKFRSSFLTRHLTNYRLRKTKCFKTFHKPTDCGVRRTNYALQLYIKSVLSLTGSTQPREYN
jgi:hypothetical protein